MVRGRAWVVRSASDFSVFFLFFFVALLCFGRRSDDSFSARSGMRNGFRTRGIYRDRDRVVYICRHASGVARLPKLVQRRYSTIFMSSCCHIPKPLRTYRVAYRLVVSLKIIALKIDAENLHVCLCVCVCVCVFVSL